MNPKCKRKLHRTSAHATTQVPLSSDTMTLYNLHQNKKLSYCKQAAYDASHCYPHTLHMDGIKFEMTVYIFVSTVFRKKHPLLFPA